LIFFFEKKIIFLNCIMSASNSAPNPAPTQAELAANAANAFSGAFAPPQVKDQKATDEFTVPLNNFNSSAQVVGETTLDGTQRLYMPGRLRKYIPVLYKQCWLNARAILSVNGFEQVDGSKTQNDDGTEDDNTSVTSDIRTTVLSNKGSDNYVATTVALRLDQEDGTESSESGMSKNVISVGPNQDGSARTLTCDPTARFMVNGGEYYNQYVFTEIGGMISYVQGLATGDALTALQKIQGLENITTVYYVTNFEGFFLNTEQSGSTAQVEGLNGEAEAEN
jgi:hypothetical protein